ncbi:PAS domain-containing sensor histidine kinase [Rubellimicrobium rubrum]|nr:PAS domain S-box protein [Rubellimicrobium rubrum]
MNLPTALSFWPPGNSHMAAFMRAADWSTSPLGAPAGWPQCLRTAVGIMLESPAPVAIFWGPERVLLHNDACIPFIGGQHSAGLGSPAAKVWPGVHDSVLKPILDRVFAGEAVTVEDHDVPLRTNQGRGEWPRVVAASFSPIRDETGVVAGVFHLLPPATQGLRLDVAQGPRDAEMESLTRLVPALLWQSDPSGAAMRFHPSWTAYTGQSPDAARDGGWLEAIHPEDRPGTARLFSEAQARQEPLETELRIRARDGRHRWFQMRHAPLTEPGRGVVRWIGAALDIHEHRLARDALAASEERFRVLVSSIEDVFYVTDLEKGRLEYLSPSYETVWGRPVATLLVDLSGFLDTLHPEDRAAFLAGKERQLRGEAVSIEYRIRRPDGAERWILDRSFPVTGRRPSLAAGVASDVTDRKRSEKALRASEERLSGIFASATVGLSEVGLDGTFLQVNDELCRILGRPREEVLRLSIPDVTHPDDIAPSFAAVAKALEGEGGADLDKRYLRPDGSLAWANSRVTRLRHGSGRADSLLVVTVDLTGRRAAEAALRHSEHRFRQFGEASTDLLWIRDASTLSFEYLSPAFETIFGLPRDQVLGGNHVLRWAGMILPEDRPRLLDDIRRVRAGDSVAQSFRIRRGTDREIRWIRGTDFPLFDERGRVERVAGIARDVTEEVETHDRLRVLVSELQHRTRNLVAVIRSVADKTLAGAGSLDDFRDRFRTRLDAIGRANALLSRLEEGDRVTFDQLIRSELAAHGTLDGDAHPARVALSGPPGVRLRSSTVQTFALALHELATNALKYGALSQPDGRLAVGWSIVDGPGGTPLLHVDWRERCRLTEREPDESERRGYGRELIERALPYQLKARTTYQIGAGGVHCTITLPISSTS